MKDKFYCVMENPNNPNKELHIFEVNEKSREVVHHSLCNHINYNNCKEPTDVNDAYDKQGLIHFCAKKENQMCGICMSVLYGNNN